MIRIRQIKWLPLGLILLLIVVIISALSGMSAANTLSESRAGDTNYPPDPNQLAPPECSHINLTNLIVVTGPNQTTNGSIGNDLILGTSGQDDIRGKGGDDCIVGGRRADQLRGNGGADVLLGGNGPDDLNGGNGNDICYGNAGNDTFTKCESTP